MITLVLGGARSGKSTYAERLAGRLPPPLTYVATLLVGDDQDLSARVARHRRRRPAEWRTLEAGLDLPSAVRSLGGRCSSTRSDRGWPPMARTAPWTQPPSAGP